MFISFAALLALGIAAFKGIKWMSKVGQINARKELPLTPTDLKVLEESAARLMADLRLTTDECVARIEKACQSAEQSIRALESFQQGSATGYASSTLSANAAASSTGDLIASASVLDAAQSPAEIARLTGATTGEIELMRGLRAIARD